MKLLFQRVVQPTTDEIHSQKQRLQTLISYMSRSNLMLAEKVHFCNVIRDFYLISWGIEPTNCPIVALGENSCILSKKLKLKGSAAVVLHNTIVQKGSFSNFRKWVESDFKEKIQLSVISTEVLSELKNLSESKIINYDLNDYNARTQLIIFNKSFIQQSNIKVITRAMLHELRHIMQNEIFFDALDLENYSNKNFVTQQQMSNFRNVDREYFMSIVSSLIGFRNMNQYKFFKNISYNIYRSRNRIIDKLKGGSSMSEYSINEWLVDPQEVDAELFSMFEFEKFSKLIINKTKPLKKLNSNSSTRTIYRKFKSGPLKVMPKLLKKSIEPYNSEYKTSEICYEELM